MPCQSLWMFSFYGFFLYCEGGGKYRKMVVRELCCCSPGGVRGKVCGDYCEVSCCRCRWDEMGSLVGLLWFMIVCFELLIMMLTVVGL